MKKAFARSRYPTKEILERRINGYIQQLTDFPTEKADALYILKKIIEPINTPPRKWERKIKKILNEKTI